MSADYLAEFKAELDEDLIPGSADYSEYSTELDPGVAEAPPADFSDFRAEIEEDDRNDLDLFNQMSNDPEIAPQDVIAAMNDSGWGGHPLARSIRNQYNLPDEHDYKQEHMIQELTSDSDAMAVGRTVGGAAVSISNQFAGTMASIPGISHLVKGITGKDGADILRGGDHIQNALEQASLRSRGGINGAGHFVETATRGALESIGTSMAVGAVNPAAVIPYFMATTAADADKEARDAGKGVFGSVGDGGFKGYLKAVASGRLGHATSQAVAEGVTAWAGGRIAKKLGLADSEMIFKNEAFRKGATGFMGRLKQIMGGMAVEQAEEFSTALLQKLDTHFVQGMDPSAFKWGRLVDEAKMTAFQTMIASGPSGTISAVDAHYADKGLENFMLKPSRKTASNRQVSQLAQFLDLDMKKNKDRQKLREAIAEIREKVETAEMVKAAAREEAPAEPGPFANMDDDQVLKQANNKVRGAKAELMRRQGATTQQIDQAIAKERLDELSKDVGEEKATELLNNEGVPVFESEEEIGLRIMREEGMSEKYIELARQYGAFGKDTVTSYQEGRAGQARIRTGRRLMKFAKKHGVDAVYGVMDIMNLGGLNKHLGDEGANKVFRAISDIMQEELTAAGGEADIQLFRHGGDEMSVFAAKINQAATNAALAKAQERIYKYAEENGLSDIIHPKHPDDLTKRGTGITFAVEAVDDSANSIEEIIEVAGKTLESNKEATTHEQRIEAEGIRALAPEGQARGTTEGTGPADSRVPGQESSEQESQPQEPVGDEQAGTGDDRAEATQPEGEVSGARPVDPVGKGSAEEVAREANEQHREWREAAELTIAKNDEAVAQIEEIREKGLPAKTTKKYARYWDQAKEDLHNTLLELGTTLRSKFENDRKFKKGAKQGKEVGSMDKDLYREIEMKAEALLEDRGMGGINSKISLADLIEEVRQYDTQKQAKFRYDEAERSGATFLALAELGLEQSQRNADTDRLLAELAERQEMIDKMNAFFEPKVETPADEAVATEEAQEAAAEPEVNKESEPEPATDRAVEENAPQVKVKKKKVKKSFAEENLASEDGKVSEIIQALPEEAQIAIADLAMEMPDQAGLIFEKLPQLAKNFDSKRGNWKSFFKGAIRKLGMKEESRSLTGKEAAMPQDNEGQDFDAPMKFDARDQFEVHSRIKAFGMNRDATDRAILDGLLDGLTGKEIAEEEGMSAAAISQRLRKMREQGLDDLYGEMQKDGILGMKKGRGKRTNFFQSFQKALADIGLLGMSKGKLANDYIKRKLDEARTKREQADQEAVSIEDLPTAGEIKARSDVGMPALKVAPLPGGVEGKKLPEILRDVAREMKKKVQVLSALKGLRGLYVSKTGQIILPSLHDLASMMHEVGHDLFKRYKMKDSMPDNVQAEIHDLGLTMVPKGNKDTNLVTQEGWAQFVYSWTVNPDEAARLFPATMKYMTEQVDGRVVEALRKNGDILRKYAGLPDAEKLLANVREQTGNESLVEKIKDLSLGDIKRYWSLFMEDDRYDLMNAIKEAQGGQLAGGKVVGTDNKTLWDALEHVGSKIGHMLRHGFRRADGTWIDGEGSKFGTIENVTETLDQSSPEAFKQDKRDMVALGIAQRILERYDVLRNKLAKLEERAAKFKAKSKGKGRIPSGIKASIAELKDHIEMIEKGEEAVTGAGAGMESDLDVARSVVQEMAKDSAKQARLQEALNRYRRLADEQLQYLLDKEYIGQEDYDRIKAENTQYFAFDTVFDPEGDAQTGQYEFIKKALRRSKESGSMIDDPLFSLYKNFGKAITEADKNEAMRGFVDFFQPENSEHPDLEAVVKVDESMEHEVKDIPNVFKVKRVVLVPQKEGEPKRVAKDEYWRITDPNLADSIKAAIGDGGNPMGVALSTISKMKVNSLKLAKLPGRIMHWGITRNPAFLFFRNIVRDAFSRGILTYNKSGMMRELRLMADPKRRNELHAELAFFGGDQGIREDLRQSYDAIMADEMRRIAGEKGLVMRAVDWYKDAGEWAERIGRITEYEAAYERAKNDGLDDYNAGLFAAAEGRDLLNFARGGIATKWISQFVPFVRSATTGGHKHARKIKGDAGNYVVNQFKYGLLIEAAVMAFNYGMAGGDDEDEIWKMQEQLDPRRRDLFWTLFLPSVEKGGQPTRLYIPKPFDMGLPASIAGRMVEYGMGHEHAFEGFGGSAWQSIMPFDESTALGPMKTAAEIMTNRNLYTGRAIVPEYEVNLPVGDRKGAQYASRLGKLLGDGLGVVAEVDPRMIDHGLRSQFGWAGTTVQRLSDVGREDKQTNWAYTATQAAEWDTPTRGRDYQWIMQKPVPKGDKGKILRSAQKRLKGLRTLFYEAKDDKVQHRISMSIIRESERARKRLERVYK